MVPVAHASDGGGSIRIPAAMLRSGRPEAVARPQLVRRRRSASAGSGFSAEHVVSRTVRDSAAMLDATAGAMPGDPYTAPPPARPYREEVGARPGPLAHRR